MEINEYFNEDGREMIERSIGFRERRYIEELRILTKSTAVDCLIDDRFDRIIYIVQSGSMGLAIGKNGDNIRKLSRVLGRHIEMVEYSENREEFVKNCFKPAEISTVVFGDESVKIFMAERTNIGLAIGKGGATVEKARLVVKRFYGKNVEDIQIIGEENDS